MSFKAEQKTLSKLLNDAIYEIPRNQRRYVWKEENWKDLFSDVIFSSETSKAHFFGSIVLQEREKRNALECYTIIDGQQRITTVILFLAALMLHFKRHNLLDDFDGTKKYLQSVDTKNNTVLVFDTDYHQSLLNLITNILKMTPEEASQKSLTAFVNAAIIDRQRDKIVGECFKYFFSVVAERIENNPTESPQKIISSLRDGIINITYVSIIATTEEDSYTIFEILNARGQTLAPHELLKNYIMRYYEPIESRDKAKAIWERMESKLGSSLGAFIEHYAAHRFPANKDVRKDPYKIVSKATKDVKPLIEDILKKSDYYELFINPNKIEVDGQFTCNPTEQKTFTFLRSKKITQFRPILLSLIHQKDNEQILESEYIKTLLFLLKFLTCYVFIGSERTNRLTDTIYKYAPILENTYSSDNLNEFICSLKSKIPSANWFNSLFQNIGYSRKGLLHDSREKDIVTTVLLLQEQHYRKTELDIAFTIEHILPDSETEANARIGNLLPIEENLNRDCDNLTLKEKIEIYKKSSFMVVRRFVERYGSSPDNFSVEKRTQYVSQLFYSEILALDELRTYQ